MLSPSQHFIMQSMVLSRESISSVYAVVIPVRPLFGLRHFVIRTEYTDIHILTPSSVQLSLCAARAVLVVFDWR